MSRITNVYTWQLRVLQVYEQYLIGPIVLLAFRDMFKGSPFAWYLYKYQTARLREVSNCKNMSVISKRWLGCDYCLLTDNTELTFCKHQNKVAAPMAFV